MSHMVQLRRHNTMPNEKVRFDTTVETPPDSLVMSLFKHVPREDVLYIFTELIELYTSGDEKIAFDTTKTILEALSTCIDGYSEICDAYTRYHFFKDEE